jgi:hypothetical protein
MTTNIVYGMSVTMALAILLSLWLGATPALNAEESPEAACPTTGLDTIIGHVKTSQGQPIAGVTLTLLGPNNCSSTARTNSNGTYKFLKLVDGTYALTPAKTNCTFTPPNAKGAVKTFNLVNFTGNGSSCK